MSVYSDPWDDRFRPADEEELSAAANAYESAHLGWTRSRREEAATLPSFKCPDCGLVSFNPIDVEEGYCGACHDWTGRTPTTTPEEITE
jgi:hypothetical protein